MESVFIGKLCNGIVTDLHESSEGELILRESEEGEKIIRHTFAHILAQALNKIYGEVLFAIGPTTSTGFYYDFYYEKNLSLNDLITIEIEMQKIIDARIEITKKKISKKEAENIFDSNPFKASILEKNEGPFTTYTQGDFVDLCKGPHVLNTGLVGSAFKLVNISEIEWHGNRLQRIEGIAFATKENLDKYLQKKKELEEYSAYNLAKKLELYYCNEEAPGSLFWLGNGMKLINLLEEYLRKVAYADYEEVRTPYLFKQDLWERTGHIEKFKENLFFLEDNYVLKPMNCPAHALIFKKKIRSYSDLPIRIGEFGFCSRKEASGARTTGKRLQCFTQDDGHIFCTEESLEAETEKLIKLVFKIYKELGFNKTIVKLGTRPEKRIENDYLWDKGEEKLESALKKNNIPFTVSPGEGAFYGPKIEFHLEDINGESWQCGTVQLDFFLPVKLGVTYIDNDGTKKFPILIHRALLGTLERFINIWLEHCKGRFPVRFTPIQAIIIPISGVFNSYGEEIFEKINKEGVRVVMDNKNERLGKKIAFWSEKAVPFLIVIGEKEKREKIISIKSYEENLAMTVEEFIERIKSE